MAFKDSTDEKFSDQISGSKLSLIQFSASWCGPCQQLKPITKYSVRGVPTILLFKEGKLLGTKVGASSEKDMLEFIKPHV